MCECCAAEELAELQTAVSGVREALSDLRANVELSRAPVLKVNVRDARDSLRRRVNQISPETSARQVTSCLCPHMQYWHKHSFDMCGFPCLVGVL